MKQTDEAKELKALDAKINALLPDRYQHCYSSTPTSSMGSASLKYGRDGKVAWNQIWTSFCDLALAGGPPHRGKLLEAVSPEDVLANPAKHQEILEELNRGIRLTTKLPVVEGFAPGWAGVQCQSLNERVCCMYT